MREFKTYVITKKTLIKIGIFILIILVITISVVIYKYNKRTVNTFSDFAMNIIDAGVAKEHKIASEEIASDIMGFNLDDPQSIISSSSTVHKEIKEEIPDVEEPTLPPTKAPVKINPGEIKLSNATEYDVDLKTMCQEPLGFKLDYTGPEVLIMHTHTTECYDGDAMTGEAERTTNESYNVCEIGSIVSNELEKKGIKTIHDKTIHDYPSYQGAYTRALSTIERNINEYPSIKVVLDIHRDAYIYPDGTKLKVSTNLDGQESAQVMLVLGTDSMGLSHPNWKSNLRFASRIQSTADAMYPNLMRPLNLRKERFNMHKTQGSILLEIGSNGNSLAEAKTAAKYIGGVIADVLLND